MSVSGTPMWLLRFPSVALVLKRVRRTDAIISFVLVLPLLPVTPIVRTESSER
jgi:hypothetical protein